MKTILFILSISVTCVLSGYIDLLPDAGDSADVFDVLYSDNDSTIIEVAIPRIWADTIYIDNEPYMVIRVPGAGFVARSEGIGAPARTVKKSAVYLPSLESVEFRVESVDDTVLTGIRLAPEDCECEDYPNCSPIDEMAYSRDGWLFDEVAALDTVFKWRAINGAGFRYNLYSYKPKSDSIRIHRRARLKITSKGQYDKPAIESWLEGVYRTAFINFKNQPYNLKSNVESYQALYIYADRGDDYYRNCAKKLAALRYSQGWRVHTTSAHEIYDIYASLYPAESETTWIRRFISDTFFYYADSSGASDLSYVGFIGPDDCDQDSLPGVKLSDDSHPPITESTYSLPVYLPRLAVGRIWGVGSYGGYGTESFVDRIVQNETEFSPGGWWDKFMFVSQTTSLIYGYVDALAQEPIIRGAGYGLSHYTCYDSLSGDPPPGTIRGMNADITSAFEDIGYAAVWHFGHGTHNAWYKSGNACCGSGEGAYTAFDLFYHNFRYPTTVISGGCRTARNFGYEFTGRGALCYYGGITDGGDSHDFAQRIRAYEKIVGDAWRNYLIWSPRLIGDPLSRFYGPNEPSQFIISSDPDSIYYNSDIDGDSLTVYIAANGPARWLHDTKICLTSGPFEDETPLCKVVPYAGHSVSFSDDEIATVPGLDLEGGDTLFITATKKDFITGTAWILAFENEESASQLLYDLDVGWNLVSVPIITCDSTLSDIFHGAACIWTWDNPTAEYVDASADSPDASSAYWILYAHKPDSFRVTGIGVRGWEKDVGFDWNFTGSAMIEDVPWGTMHTYEGTGFEATRTFLFRYNTSIENYEPTMTVHKGCGYLYNVRGNGTISFPDSVVSIKQKNAGLFAALGRLPSPPAVVDTAHFAVLVDWNDNSISVRDLSSKIPIENAMVVVMVGDSVEFLYTGTKESGNYGLAKSGLPIDLDDSTRIMVKKPGFVDYQIYPFGIVQGNDTLRGDIELHGDLMVSGGDTLTIASGTRIFIDNDVNLAEGLSEASELIVDGDGSFLRIVGSRAAPVTIEPMGESSWGGIIARSAGSFDIEWAELSNPEAVMAAQDGIGPGDCSMSHTNITGNCIVMGDWRGASARFGSFDIDSCSIEGRIALYDVGKRCTIGGTRIDGHGECFYVGGATDTVLFESCDFLGYSRDGGRIAPKGNAIFHDCDFLGRGIPIINYGYANIRACRMDAGGSAFALYTSQKSKTKASFCTFENYTVASAFAGADLDFGNDEATHNCFLTDTARWTFVGANATVYAKFCYFDTLVVGPGVEVLAYYKDLFCKPDTSLTKIICDDGSPCFPEEFELGFAVPNPFNSKVNIEFGVPDDSDVMLEIYNIAGQRVAILVDGLLSAGNYRATWDGRDLRGNPLPSGIYMYSMTAKTNSEPLFKATKKMVLMK